MTQISGSILVAAQEVLVQSTVQQHLPGEKAFTNDGRTFRYAKAGAVALVPGNVLQSPSVIPLHTNLTPTAVSAVGASSVTVTLGATAATADQYAGGFLVVELGTTGAGQSLKIKSHPAANASGTLLITLEDPFYVATSGTITMSLIANNYNGVIQAPVTTLLGPVVGVAIVPTAAGSFGWIQTRGSGALMVSGVAIVGSAVGSPSTTAGAAIADSAILNHIAVTQKLSISLQQTPCYITID